MVSQLNGSIFLSSVVLFCSNTETETKQNRQLELNPWPKETVDILSIQLKGTRYHGIKTDNFIDFEEEFSRTSEADP